MMMIRSELTLIFCAIAVFSTILNHTVHCDENVQSTTILETVKEIPSTDNPPIKKENSHKRELPTPEKKESGKKDKKPAVIIVAEKVDNPPNWNTWTPVAQNSTNWFPTPFTFPAETDNVQRPIRQHHQQYQPQPHTPESHYVKGAKKTKKPTGYDKWSLEDMQSRVMGYGKMLFSNFMAGMATGGSMPMGDIAGLASEYISNHVPFEGGQGHDGAGGGGGHVEGRGIVSWISRLIGVDGKSLGEFLREYQVHVLYDLVFTFFKWIFFLYAGLLIP